MSLQIDFNVKESDNARELSFTETTGIYNASDNPGGYGTPNDDPGDATVVELKITAPDESEVTIDMLANGSGFPTNDKTVEFIIRSQDLGLGTDAELPDGVWTIKYEITTPGESSIVYSNQIICVSGQARCDVYSMLCDAAVDPCGCDSSMARALEAYTYYRAAICCALCGNDTQFENLLEVIDDYTNDTCNTCSTC